MATKEYEITDAWTEITEAGATSADDFVLQCTYGRIGLAFGTAAPTTEAYYTLHDDDVFIRGGVTGKVYVKSTIVDLLSVPVTSGVVVTGA